jgi:hypothetical protein
LPTSSPRLTVGVRDAPDYNLALASGALAVTGSELSVSHDDGLDLKVLL